MKTFDIIGPDEAIRPALEIDTGTPMKEITDLLPGNFFG